MAPALRELRRLIRLRLGEARDMVGYDVAALRMITRTAAARKESFLPVGASSRDIWAGLGLGSDVAASLQGRANKKN